MPLTLVWIAFVGAAAVIAVVGVRLTTIADRLADRTGLGEAIIGATLLGAATSLPGITASVTAAIDGYPRLAFSNAIGGIAAQTLFLAIADICYRRANLEHAAASLANMLQATLLVFILSVVVVTMALPEVQFFGVHPTSVLLFVVYLAGMKMVKSAKESPMWQPRRTSHTRTDEPDESKTPPSADRWLWLQFAMFALLVVGAGHLVTKAVSTMMGTYGWLSESAAGAFMTAIATSLPELVTSIAAVRRGALQLAVAGIIGGNCFDTLFAAVADVAYRDGSLYHAVSSAASGSISSELALVGGAIAMTTLLLGGLLFRQERGPGKIGFESAGVAVIYIVLVIATTI